MRSLFLLFFLLLTAAITTSTYLSQLFLDDSYAQEVADEHLYQGELISFAINNQWQAQPQMLPQIIKSWGQMLGPEVQLRLITSAEYQQWLPDKQPKVLELEIELKTDFTTTVVPLGEDQGLLLRFSDSYSEDYMWEYYLSEWIAISLLGLFILSISYWLYRYLKRLGYVTNEIAKGNFTIKAPKSKVAAFDALSNDINALATKLSQHDQQQIVFNSALHHETRIPLQRMRLALDMAKDEKDSDDLLLLLQDMDEDLQELSELTEDMLLLARLRFHDDSPPLQPFNASKHLIQLFESAPYKVTKLETTKNLWIHLTPNLLTRVATNLLSNAQKFSQQKLECYWFEQDGKAHLKVVDDGEGIEQKVRQQILQPFFQSDGANKNKGLGIGLALVKQISEFTQGEISINESCYGGAEVIVSWPIKDRS